MRKNILLFGHSYATQFIDISNQYTAIFDKDKYEVTVAYLVGEPDDAIRQKHTADHVIFLNPPKSSVRNLKIAPIKTLLKLCREKQFEIVVCHRYKPTYIMLWVSLFHKTPALFFVMHELGTLKSFFRKLTIAALAKTQMFFAGVSNAVRDDLRRDIWRVPPERVITLYNMIDVAWTEKNILPRHTARERLAISDDVFLFGNIGRLAKNKDQKTLIHAFALIKPTCPNTKLIIIGDGVLEEELRALTKTLHIENDVILTGFLPEAFRFLKAFDVLISASIQEAFGRVLIEAMVAKTPIIATAVNGVPEVIGDTGPLLPPQQIKLMADEMQKAYALTPEQRTAWGEKGYTRAVSEFSVERFKRVFFDYFNRIS